MEKRGPAARLGHEVGRRSFGNLMYDEEMRAMRGAGDESGPGCGPGCLAAVTVIAVILVITFLLI